MGRTAIIGFGCAGYHAAKTLREHDPNMVIDVYSDTAEAPYNPMLTTYFVSERIQQEGMFPFGDLEHVQKELGVNILANTRVTHLYAKERVVETAAGRSEPYDDIVICTGAYPVVPPFARGLERNSYTMRTVEDARTLEQKLNTGTVKSAVVVGAQMVGIKVVELLWKRNIKTILVDMAPRIFPVSACESISEIIQDRLAEKGIEQRYSCGLSTVECTENGIYSTFADGSSAETDIIVFCSGIRANLPFVDPEEVKLGRAVEVDLQMRTSVPHVYACGDCCEVTDMQTGANSSIGLWANAREQGKIAAQNILGQQTAYQGNLIHNITHFMDMDFISIGNCNAPGEHVRWENVRDGWQIEAILNESGETECINILDNAKVSGPLKALFIKRLKSPEAPLPPALEMRLIRSGVPTELIALLDGRK